jgi:hypothetical protein
MRFSFQTRMLLAVILALIGIGIAALVRILV